MSDRIQDTQSYEDSKHQSATKTPRKKCGNESCHRNARSGTNFCIKHGGGPRCIAQNCIRGARDKSGYCIRHGGGPRCRAIGCNKGAEKKDGFCILHGRAVQTLTQPTGNDNLSNRVTLPLSIPSSIFNSDIGCKYLFPESFDQLPNTEHVTDIQHGVPTPKRPRELDEIIQQINPEKRAKGNLFDNAAVLDVNSLLSSDQPQSKSFPSIGSGLNIGGSTAAMSLQSAIDILSTQKALSLLKQMTQNQTLSAIRTLNKQATIQEQINHLLLSNSTSPLKWNNGLQDQQRQLELSLLQSQLTNSLIGDEKTLSQGSGLNNLSSLSLLSKIASCPLRSTRPSLFDSSHPFRSNE